jgi:hypothetical protein
MDKHILHSVLETLTAGNNVTINFIEPFADLSGDYMVMASKVGRGRGGSRVIEIAPVGSPDDAFGALEIDGKEKALGTGTSEYISTIVFDGKTFGLEDPIEASRKPVARRPRNAGTDGQTAAPVTARQREAGKRARVSSDVAQSQRVAKALGDILTENPETNFKLVSSNRNSALNGEWKVASFEYADMALKMQLVDIDNSERTFDFDSTVHGVEIRDAQVIEVAGA